MAVGHKQSDKAHGHLAKQSILFSINFNFLLIFSSGIYIYIAFFLILKIYGSFKDNLSYIAISHKLILISFDKRSVRSSRCLDLLNFTINLLYYVANTPTMIRTWHNISAWIRNLSHPLLMLFYCVYHLSSLREYWYVTYDMMLHTFACMVLKYTLLPGIPNFSVG